jgi:hypothetical protein
VRYYPKDAKGFKIDDFVAQDLGIEECWGEWDGEQFDSDLAYEIEEKLGVYPYRIVKFEDSRGGEITGLTGFENGETYVLFGSGEDGEAWEKLEALLEEKDISVESGSWSQLM